MAVNQTNSGAVVVTDPNGAGATNSQQARRYAGKFNSVEELEASYDSQMTETNKIIARAQETERQATILKALLQERGNGNQGGGNAQPQSAIAQLAENANFDPNQLQAAIREAVAAELAPVSAVMTARQRVGAEIPEFGSREPEIAVFLNANPETDAEYREMVRNPALAAAGMRYVYREMEAAARRASATDNQVDASGQAQAEARLDAMLPGGSGGRAAAVAAASANDLDELKKRAIGGGREDKERWLAAKYGTSLSDR